MSADAAQLLSPALKLEQSELGTSVMARQYIASGEVLVREYVEGEYFGEIALLFSSPRKATVRANGYCRCLYISRHVFESTLGAIKDILKQDVALYTKYAEAIKEATEMEAQDGSDAGDDEIEPPRRRRRATPPVPMPQPTGSMDLDSQNARHCVRRLQI